MSVTEYVGVHVERWWSDEAGELVDIQESYSPPMRSDDFDGLDAATVGAMVLEMAERLKGFRT